ncbi:2-hydroxyacid dehydrogenase [Caldisericum exile]|uniref:2-hydroxyacid dehydrogenase n=1 Tax=Caldisericum exile TaxID=693075 RepID=UPI003C77F582
MKVVVMGNYPKNLLEMFDKYKKEFDFENVEVVIPKDDSEKEDALKDAVAVISGSLTENDLNNAPNLKFIQVPFAGVDTYNIPELIRRGIKIANVHSNATAVAEFAMALVLALAKNVVEGDRDLRIGYWHGWMSREPVISLEGKTMTILGLGSIGKEIARFAKVFHMYVIGVKREKVDGKIPNVDEIYTHAEIEKAVEKAHFVVCALPLTPETKGMINKRLFENMSGKFFVNVGRGAVVNEEDLFVALKNGILRGAGIDTWWVYPQAPMQTAMPSRYPFHGLKNIIMTPHAAGFTDVTPQKMWEDSVKNVIRFLKGLPIENEVKEVGY